MIDNLKIKLVQKKDLEKLGLAYCEAFNASNFLEQWSLEKAVALVKYFYKIQSDLLFIAEINGEIAGGIMSLIKPWYDGFRLVDGELFVTPKYQKRSIAKQLMIIQIETAVKKYNISMVEGITVPENKFPCTWYKRVGLQVSGLTHIEGEPKNILIRLKSKN